MTPIVFRLYGSDGSVMITLNNDKYGVHMRDRLAWFNCKHKHSKDNLWSIICHELHIDEETGENERR